MSDTPIDPRLTNTLRKNALVSRRRMSNNDRWHASLRVADQVFRQPFFRRSRLIGCYLPKDDEVDSWPIIARAWQMKKRIFAPIIAQTGEMLFREVSAESDLVCSQYGIPEPVSGEIVSARRLDIVLTPVVAFDSHNNRIGMGGGYFDRVFSFLGGRRVYFKPKLIGLAFACQRVDKISPNPWDIRLFQIITDADSA